MDGPFNLTQNNIDKVKEQAGVYILGGKSADGKSWGCYVGRSDNDISERLQFWFDLIEGARKPENTTDRCILGKGPDHYWRAYTNTSRKAYNEECRVYHKHGYTCNAIHPAKSNNAWSHLVCGE
jgi:hypothetical protein